MILSHIVAASDNNVIGVDGDLPWHLPEDLKFFKEKTSGRIMIMGRKTFESLPGGKPLPHRLHIIITRNPDYKIDNAITVTTIDAAIEEAKKHTADYGDEVFIVGGGEIYKQSIEKMDRLYVTRIHKKIDGDTYYPEIPSSFEITEKTSRQLPLSYDFLTYIKKDAL